MHVKSRHFYVQKNERPKTRRKSKIQPIVLHEKCSSPTLPIFCHDGVMSEPLMKKKVCNAIEVLFYQQLRFEGRGVSATLQPIIAHALPYTPPVEPKCISNTHQRESGAEISSTPTCSRTPSALKRIGHHEPARVCPLLQNGENAYHADRVERRSKSTPPKKPGNARDVLLISTYSSTSNSPRAPT